MSLAAMVIGSRRFANRHDLLAGPLVVPAGVTALNILAAAPGGGVLPNTVGSPTTGAGGGGGGAAIINCTLAVAPGDIVDVDLPAGDTRRLLLNGVGQATVQAGGTSNFTDPRGAAGGLASWGASFVPGGNGGTAAGANGVSGHVLAVAGGTIIGGGGGGAGNTVAPPLAGGAGGSSGGYAGSDGVSFYGGGGAGYFSGATRLTASTTTSFGAFLFFAEW